MTKNKQEVQEVQEVQDVPQEVKLGDNVEEVEAPIVKAPKKAAVSKPKQSPTGNNKDIVFVGKKGTSAYVLAVMTQFSRGANTVSIKARGRAISRAVDVAEIVRNKPEVNAKLDAISISTEQVQTMDGKPLKVSTIEIVLKK